MYGNGSLRRQEDSVEIVTSFADNLDGAMIRIGWLLQKDWHRAESNSKLSELLLAVLHVASCGLYLKGCIGARIGGGISVLEGIAECDTMFLWWWQRGKPWQSSYLEGSGVDRVKLVEVFGKEQWKYTSFIQFLTVTPSDVDAIRAREPRIPHLGGPFVPRLVAPRPRAQSVDTDRSRTDRNGESDADTP